MDRFLPQNDSTAKFIAERAEELYHRIRSIDFDSLGMPDHCLQYLKSSHTHRLFFSIETSAHLLYRAISLKGKKISDIVLMDYGAGVGTLFLLAKMIGCRHIIYNDHLADWQKSARLMAEAANIAIDDYIVGDIGECLQILREKGVSCDIITSRNVIEHIYKLEEFYGQLYSMQPDAIIYSSTTANISNPASVIKHRLWHRRWEKVFKGKRLAIILREFPAINQSNAQKLATATRGKAVSELTEAINQFRDDGSLPDPSIFGSNTCDPDNGVWAEHLLSKKQYRQLINTSHYRVTFAPGFWDTHYSKWYMNKAGRMFNAIIARNSGSAVRVAPFIYVVAEPVKTISHEHRPG